jgi:4-hydroxy-tetrahydrodipicolinate reductase
MRPVAPLRLAILGYGKMGRAIEVAARERGHTLATIIDPALGTGLESLAESGAQVAIDFSTGEAVVDNVAAASDAGIGLVVGTTGWNHRMTAAKILVEQAGTGMIYAPNFAIGVHIFRKVVEAAAALVDRVDLYDVLISEAHHEHKIDAPSGTAIHLAEAVLARMKSKDGWHAQPEEDGALPDPRQLRVSSTRAGETPGTHIVSFEGKLDRIELKHEALDRSVFALGAVMAAEWVHGRSGWFTIDDFFSKDDS